jgi:hypothetical protein
VCLGAFEHVHARNTGSFESLYIMILARLVYDLLLLATSADHCVGVRKIVDHCVTDWCSVLTLNAQYHGGV